MRRDLERFTESFVDRPLSDISAQETIEDLLALLRRHYIRLPGPLALLLKSLMMMEGVGLQLDPDLDVFGIARPYVQRALAEQFSPAVLGAQATRTARGIGQVALELPHQVSDVLGRLADGELSIRTREVELRRVSGALIGAANRIAVGLVLAALILGMGMVAIAVGIGGWSGLAPALMLGVGGVVLVIGMLMLALALLRGRE